MSKRSFVAPKGRSFTPAERLTLGRCTAGKLQRILASMPFSQHAKLNMARFVLYLLGQFALR
jgi:hypothetical protein